MLATTMNNLLKKTILSAVGAAVVTREKAQAAIDDFVRQGRVDAKDAKAIAEKIAVEGRKEFEKVSRTLGGRIKETLARVDGSGARIAELEARLKSLEKKPAVKAARKRKA